MKKRKKKQMLYFLLTFALFLISAESAQAYIGPGAGFAFLSSFLVFVISFALLLFYLFSLPLRILWKALFRKKPKTENKFKSVIILGFDGMDPKLTDEYMQAGSLPTFKKLKNEGAFAPLTTSTPSLSPAAWSSFMTGTDPSYHNIFDFITRDPGTYLPMLSSATIGKATRHLSLGKYLIPLGKPKIKLLRKSQPFWKILGQCGVFSSIIHVPITFPPEKFNGLLLSGMCTPDLNGSQGTFTFYTTKKVDQNDKIGGLCFHVEKNGNRIDTCLYGPNNPFTENGSKLTTALNIAVLEENSAIELKVCGRKYKLEKGTYSPWMKVAFKPAIGIKIRGICRFYLNKVSPDLELYVSPLNIDPEKPALPISHPFVYSLYLAKLIGLYATLGLAEDTWALNEGIIDEDAFLKQAYLYYKEREKIFLKALEKTSHGLCCCVFDTTDRIQHMFFRYLDETHPANNGREIENYKHAIKQAYQQMDSLLAKVIDQIDNQTLVMVISDHGFLPFRRGVNLNTWLYQNGYLYLRDGKTSSGDWFEDVDWQRTKAYTLGLTGIFINRQDRESKGIVAEGKELRNLKQELVTKLTGLPDEETGENAILRARDTESMYSGPYTYDAPDILIGYNTGYRSSWACATGRVTENVFEDNTRLWSGDHCADSQIVPGVFFANKNIEKDNPDIKDIAPTVLDIFGADIPTYMQGESLFKEHKDQEN